MCSATGYDNGMTTEPDNQPDQPRRRWRWQFSLLMLLVVMTVVCVVGGVYMGPEYRRRADDARLKAYQAEWAEMGAVVNDDASRDEEVTRLDLSENNLTTLLPEVWQLTPAFRTFFLQK